MNKPALLTKTLFDPGGPDIYEQIFSLSLITALISGGDWRADTASTIEIDEREVFIADRDNRTFKILTRPAVTGIAHSGNAVSRIDLDSNGDPVLQSFTGQMTELEKMNGNIQLGIVSHFDGVNIDEEFTTISAVFGADPTANQEVFATGDKLQNDMELLFEVADLTFGLAGGSYISPFAQEVHNCPDQPYQISQVPISVAGVDANTSFARSWYGNTAQVGSLSAFVSTIDPNAWDDPTLTPGASAPSGTLSGLESQNIFFTAAKSKTGFRIIAEYGRIKHAKLQDAIDAALNEHNSRGHALNLDGSFGLGTLSLRNGATDLTDANYAALTKPPSILRTTRA